MKRARNRSVSTPHNAGESFSFSRIRGHRFIQSEAKRGRILLHSAAPFNRPIQSTGGLRPGGGRPSFTSQIRTSETWEVKDRKSTRLNSSHVRISYAVFCLKKKKK